MRRALRAVGAVLWFVYCIPRNLLKAPIRFYRRFLSRAKGGACCRFTPTCSQYALEALTLWGALLGSLLTVWRLLRCQPFSRGGYDPVPTPPWKRKDAQESAPNGHDGT